MGVFVVQVRTGQELRVAELICKVTGPATQECFVPQRVVQKRNNGSWKLMQETLFPGYVFLETRAPADVRQMLGKVPTFTRMLTVMNDDLIPLSREEVSWLALFTDAKTHVLEHSEGVIEGDRVVVTCGPLKGHEADIVKINRHKRLAWVDVDMCGRRKTIRVGLEIVSKSR